MDEFLAPWAVGLISIIAVLAAAANTVVSLTTRANQKGVQANQKQINGVQEEQEKLIEAMKERIEFSENELERIRKISARQEIEIQNIKKDRDDWQRKYYELLVSKQGSVPNDA